MNKKALVLFAVLVIAFVATMPNVWSDYQDWLDGWNYRTPIRFYNGNGTQLVDVQVSFTLPRNSLVNSGKMQADMGDLVVCDSDALTALPVWVENVTAPTATIWARVPLIPLGVNYTLFAYYGNALASQEFNSSAVFERVIDSGVVLALPMNEGAGNLIDYSGNGNTGTVTNATWVATGKFGNALSFDGAGDKVVVTNDASIRGLTSCTFIIYYKIESNPVATKYLWYYGYWHGPNNGFNHRQLNDGQTDLYFKNTDGDVATAQYSNRVGWRCDGGSWDGANCQFYEDGAASGAPQALDAQMDPTVDLTLGAYDDGSDGCISLMNGFFMFNTNLSAAQMADLNTYYPQCSSANLGSLYLREWYNDCTVTNQPETSIEIPVAPTRAEITWALLFVLCLNVAMIFTKRPILSIVVGLFTIAIVALSFQTGYTVIFNGYLQAMLFFTSIACMIISFKVGSR